MLFLSSSTSSPFGVFSVPARPSYNLVGDRLQYPIPIFKLVLPAKVLLTTPAKPTVPNQYDFRCTIFFAYAHDPLTHYSGPLVMNIDIVPPAAAGPSFPILGCLDLTCCSTSWQASKATLVQWTRLDLRDNQAGAATSTKQYGQCPYYDRPTTDRPSD